MITAVVPVSPIPSHPDTVILRETLASIRHHLSDAEIIVTFDGIRPEQEDRRADYDEHVRRVSRLVDENTRTVIFFDHRHQVGMLRAVIGEIYTPLMIYVEQDTPLVTDLPIDIEDIAAQLMSGRSDLVRLHHEAVIPDAHRHLMHGRTGAFLRTSQWSQRPHIARTDYYQRILDDHFSADARCFIEDRMHGVIQDAWGTGDKDAHRLHIWRPTDGNFKRTYHLDGRAGTAKYDAEQRF